MNSLRVPERQASLLDVLDRLLETGVVVAGELTLTVANVDLIFASLRLVLTSVDKAREVRGGYGEGSPLPDPPGYPGWGENAAGGTAVALNTAGGAAVTPRMAGGAAVAPRMAGGTAVTVNMAGGTGVPACGSEELPENDRMPVPPFLLDKGVAREEASETKQGNIIEASSPAPALAKEPADCVIDPDKLADGLSQLVLTVVELLRKLLEREVLRRMERGTLAPAEMERLGQAFAKLEQKMQELKTVFHFRDEDLNLDLGPLGKLL